ncbi:homeobox protein DBX1-like [Bacillus rossius redtenbacheri]|uniref:homeobox protein DBX1-like n=1 Tax=Bacillus rossius redtenbacheri TaxID=93214 RepID=UPI002FDD6DEF
MKWRNSKERELLASGGSREQTLPNKNNPNPDLSDAEGDRPRLDLGEISPLATPKDGYDAAALHDERLDDDSAGEDNDDDEEISVT